MNCSIDEMAGRLELYVLKRQIGIAEILAHEFSNDQSSAPLKDSGFAILSIVMAYFEMIEQLMTGQVSKKSCEGFVAAFQRMYWGEGFFAKEIEYVYYWVRCQMYHCGMVNRGLNRGERMAVRLSRDYLKAFAFCDGELRINPSRVVADVKADFVEYMRSLRDPCCCQRRENFVKICEIMGAGQSTPDTRTPGTPDPLSSR